MYSRLFLNKAHLIVSIILILLSCVFYIFFIKNDLFQSVIFSLTFVLLLNFLFVRAFIASMNLMAPNILNSIEIRLYPGEKLIIEGGANHLRNFARVGGKLVLTDQRLIFKSHRLNIRSEEQVFALEQIKNFSPSSVKGVNIELINNETHQFNVNDPVEWLEEIKKIKG